MFHLGMWRERMRNALVEVSEGRSYPAPPSNIDEVNDAELANGIGTPLADAAARSDHLLGEIIGLYTKVGERPFDWYDTRATSDAVLLNSYTHPRQHLYQYLRENGVHEPADQLWEDGVTDLREASAPPARVGAALYNLACVRVHQNRTDDAIDLLREALVLRPDTKQAAPNDPELAPLRDDPRFQDLIKS